MIGKWGDGTRWKIFKARFRQPELWWLVPPLRSKLHAAKYPSFESARVAFIGAVQ